MRWPLDDFELSDPFGMRLHPIAGVHRMHWGLDFAAPAGAPIRAIADGHIRSAGTSAGAGHWVMLQLDDGTLADHFHMLHPTTRRPGERVAEGDVIGLVGSTGASTGPHLHLEIWSGGQRVDPDPFIRSRLTHAPTPLPNLEDPMIIVKLLDPQAAGACYLVTAAGMAHITRLRTVEELRARNVQFWEMYYGDFADMVQLIHAAAGVEHAHTRNLLHQLAAKIGA